MTEEEYRLQALAIQASQAEEANEFRRKTLAWSSTLVDAALAALKDINGAPLAISKEQRLYLVALEHLVDQHFYSNLGARLQGPSIDKERCEVRLQQGSLLLLLSIIKAGLAQSLQEADQLLLESDILNKLSDELKKVGL